jgi:hypothetical protein
MTGLASVSLRRERVAEQADVIVIGAVCTSSLAIDLGTTR